MGYACGLDGLLQAKDSSFLLLDGLTLIREGDAQLGQLPLKPRNLPFPLLEGCSRPLECGALLLKETLGLFPRQVLTLEGGPSLSESNSLLLELSIRLLARVPLALKLLLRRSEGGSLVSQAGPQLLDLLGLFLSLALPGPCSLEGRTVLLELGVSRGHLRLPFRCHGPHPGQILIPLQEHHPHPCNCGGVFRSSGVLLQELVAHGLDPILQPPVVGPQVLTVNFCQPIYEFTFNVGIDLLF
jgi:hypothetical protein